MRNLTRTRRPDFLPRSSGILLHVTSLPGPHGCGDLGAEAHRFLEVLAESGQGWWQMLPIGPPGRAPGWSPYDSASAFAGSPWLVSLTSIARQGLLPPHELKPPPGLTSRRVNFAATLRYREKQLRRACPRLRFASLRWKDSMVQSGIKPQEELDELLPFERLLAEISTLFINLPADKIDNEIVAAQRRICEFLELDRSTLWIASEDDPEILLLTHVHQPLEIPSPPERMSTKDFFPWTAKKVLGGETLSISKMTELPAEAGRDREVFGLYGTKSSVFVPLSVGKGPVLGVLTFAVTRDERDWPKRVVQQFQLVAQIFANALARKRADQDLRESERRLREQLKEIKRLRLQLEQENIYLRDEIMLQHGHDEIVGRSAAMKKVLAQVEQVAGSEATVLLQGETGTGKELLARTIHNLSNRKARPLITINCAALPPTLIEAELFGREKGAYTGAMTRMAGRFEVAERSTLFLDEIGELSIELQAKLLRVVEEGRFERLGSTKSLQVDVRIIAATNRDLAQEVAAGRFRRDLYYRLNVFPISIPPLRERSEDIPPLVWTFVNQYEKKLGKRVDHIPRNAMDAMQRYPWPGNARQLRNIVEHAMITSSGGKLHLHPPDQAPGDIPTSGSLEEAERKHILGVLVKTAWRIAGKGGAAEILGMKRTTLLSKIKKLGIKRPTL